MNLLEVETYLNNVELLAELRGPQLAEVEALMEQPGLGHLLGLLLGEKQAAYVRLSNLSLDTDKGRYQAAVTQGHIKGIDAVRNTLLELFTPADASSQGAST